jgi:DNA-binding NtrC family response regulator
MVTIDVGETIELGDATTLVVQAREAQRQPRRLWPHGYFEGLLEEECARATRTRSEFTLLRVSVIAQGGPGATDGGTDRAMVAEAVKLEACLAESLRSTDIIAAYAPGEYEVLLIDTSAGRAQIVCDRLRSAAQHRDIDVRIGLASLPRDGRSPQALLARAEASLRGGGEARITSTDVAERSAGLQQAPTMARLERLIERVAKSNISIILVGETGVGKEVIARQIHQLSERSGAPFVSINCAAMDAIALEAELFGQEAPASPGGGEGAVETRTGMLEAAQGGTILLDEVGEMPEALQATLLRALEESKVTPLGGGQARSINVRVIAATSRDLETAVARGQFRQDLYFRLNGITLHIPPLRERTEELAPLATEFLRRAANELHPGTEPSISPEAMALLRSYWWPGNIRELRNVMERAAMLAHGGVVKREHLAIEKMGATLAQKHDGGNGAGRGEGAWANPSMGQVSIGEGESEGEPGGEDYGGELGGEGVAEGEGSGGEGISPVLKDELQRLERHRIMEALQRFGGNQTRAARYLGMARNTLMSRMDAYGIPRPRKPT